VTDNPADNGIVRRERRINIRRPGLSEFSFSRTGWISITTAVLPGRIAGNEKAAPAG